MMQGHTNVKKKPQIVDKLTWANQYQKVGEVPLTDIYKLSLTQTEACM
jgi:hypothetical protein